MDSKVVLEWKDRFIPCTMERMIAPNIFWRPIRSWHSNTYAGEQMLNTPSGDRSGCAKEIHGSHLLHCYIPYTATHRIYWNNETDETISAFLSYPNGMGACDEYFWEALFEDTERWFDENAEIEMEEAIIERLTRHLRYTDIELEFNCDTCF